MTAPFSHTQRPVRLTVSLQAIARKGAPSTGPIDRTLVIPQHGLVEIGRASTSATKNRKPAADNALFECAVMSRHHAAISAPKGPHGPIMLEDTGSMHGVYVNGRKILRTEIFSRDEIRFGSQVTRAEATFDGVEVRITNIVRSGASFSNPFSTSTLTNTSTSVTLPESSKKVNPPSYRVPGYDTDSSKEDLTSITSEEPSITVKPSISTKPSTVIKPATYIDLDPPSPPVYARSVVEVDDFTDNMSEEVSDFDSEFDDGYDYPDNPDEIDHDDDSQAASDRDESPGLSESFNDYSDEEDVIDSESEESFETQLDNTTVLPVVESFKSKAADTQAHTQTQAQAQEVEKPRDTAEEVMSIPWLVENSMTAAANEWYYPHITLPQLHYDSIKIPLAPSQKDDSLATSKDDISAAPRDQKKDPEIKAIQNTDDLRIDDDVVVQEVIAESRVAPAVFTPITAPEPAVAEKQIAAQAPTAAELFHKVDSPTGSKRKRDVEDDGHEALPASSTARRLFKFRLGPQHKKALANFLPKRTIVKAAPRPIKRAKRSTAKVALSAFAGALGGMATVVGVLMTPQCEQLLANWPMP
ncbi:hypothetical protein M438DRAFT_187012 [Aureobasidium pullulans EXF-150]|uniref:FHA domain-containing protein n=1 Tax=Aureobasidium pullulans EXF-150 TaxID=1043002 RepID=A0A074XK72_AURPU|nr:uncharacterized protein M438DRAFT_187012 [Aureobasidium pullulans EXF-150]KEQ85918.1 hypothetical protein M438DRAFT_187012 [Aureobasidium pullulans EXF-150]